MRSYVYSILARQKQLVILLIGLLLAAYASFPAHVVQAADAASIADSDNQEEIYQALKEGKRLLHEKSYTEPEQPTVYLTFDDGPSKLTPTVLDILAKEGIKATFFALGEQAEAHPDLIKRIVKEGHTLGNHSYDHVYKELYGDYQNFWDQIQRSEQIFNDTAGVRPWLIRAPGGTFTNFDSYYDYLLDQAGYTVVDWNVDSGDSNRPNVPVQEILSNVKKASLHHEINILFHDGTGHDASVQALPEVIKYYKDKGYAFAPLTPEVKPIHFSQGKSKWTRSMDLAHFKEFLLQARQFAGKQSGDEASQDDSAQQLAQSKGTVQDQEQPGQASPPSPEVPLQIKLGTRDFTVDKDQYHVLGKRIELSLRYLIEQLGGKVIWHNETRTASIHYGIYDIDYVLPAGSIRVYVLGRLVDVYHIADMKLVNGTIEVPLFETLDMLGSRVTDYETEAGKREVVIGFQSQFLWRQHDGILKDSLFALGM